MAYVNEELIIEMSKKLNALKGYLIGDIKNIIPENHEVEVDYNFNEGINLNIIDIDVYNSALKNNLARLEKDITFKLCIPFRFIIPSYWEVANTGKLKFIRVRVHIRFYYLPDEPKQLLNISLLEKAFKRMNLLRDLS